MATADKELYSEALFQICNKTLEGNYEQKAKQAKRMLIALETLMEIGKEGYIQIERLSISAPEGFIRSEAEKHIAEIRSIKRN